MHKPLPASSKNVFTPRATTQAAAGSPRRQAPHLIAPYPVHECKLADASQSWQVRTSERRCLSSNASVRIPAYKIKCLQPSVQQSELMLPSGTFRTRLLQATMGICMWERSIKGDIVLRGSFRVPVECSRANLLKPTRACCFPP